MIDINLVPTELRERKQWLVWRFEPGKKKPLKVPYWANGSKRSGTQGDDKDRANLVTLDQAVAVLNAPRANPFSGIGFAFLPNDGLIGIDIDKCIDLETGEMSTMASGIINACQSYTEYSPSGTGVHIIVAGHTETFKSNTIGLEVFCSSQYFTFTGKHFDGLPLAINPIAEPVLNRLRVTVKGASNAAAKHARTGAAPVHSPDSPVSELAKIESALAFISSDGHDDWIRIGMGLYSALGDRGFSVWDYWSSKAESYGGTDECQKRWASFGTRGNQITAATIFKMAIDAGWKPPRVRESIAPAHADSRGVEAKSSKPALAAEVPSTPPPASADPADDWQIMLLKKGYSTAANDCRENVSMVLEHDPALVGLVGWDEFAGRRVKLQASPWAADLSEWSETDDFELGLYLARKYGMVIKAASMIEQAVAYVAQKNCFNPVKNYLDAVAWDGTPRLATWVRDVMGADDNPYHALVGRIFILSMVARAYLPGCKMDTTPVFEGEQGRGKSTAMAVLGGDWYKDTPFKIGDKDSYLQIQGAWLYELSELDSLNKAEATEIKVFLSSKDDDFREPYGRRTKNYPRRTCFAGTTNQSEYFKDTTGNRRFLPVRCGEINIPLLKEIRDQLFAEAVRLFQDGAEWHPTRKESEELINEQLDARMLEDAWEKRIRMYLNGIAESDDAIPRQRVDVVDSYELITRALHIEIGKVSQAKSESTRVGNIMKKFGWPKEKKTVRGDRGWYWVRPRDEYVPE
jgi:putative DNA primase/helicase